VTQQCLVVMRIVVFSRASRNRDRILAAKIWIKAMKQKDYEKSKAPRLLKPHEAESLLKDAREISAWMRAEIKRRGAVKSTNKIVDRDTGL
jgi:hypothetical protein